MQFTILFFLKQRSYDYVVDKKLSPIKYSGKVMESANIT